MKKVVTALAASFAIAAGAAALQAQQNPPPPPPPPAQTAQPQQTPPTTTPPQDAAGDVTLTGCLIQGSSPAVFIFENAKKDAKSATEKGVSYIVVSTSADMNLRDHLNHQIEIKGKPDTKTAPVTGTGKVEEKDLPKLSAKSLKLVSNTCSAPQR